MAIYEIYHIVAKEDFLYTSLPAKSLLHQNI